MMEQREDVDGEATQVLMERKRGKDAVDVKGKEGDDGEGWRCLWKGKENVDGKEREELMVQRERC